MGLKTFEVVVFVLVCPGDAQLVQHGFSGCLRDVSFKITDSPSEEWKSLNWATATKRVASYESWEGCPLQSVDGAHFLGHGRILLIVADNIMFGGFFVNLLSFI